MVKTVISEEFLQQIETLQMLIRNNVAGMFGGTHQTKTFGSSCEFADYRDYAPGDDVSKIDWNACARFDKLYLKLYLDERQMHTKIYIDASRSMKYASSKKAEQALRIAAVLAYMSVDCMDKVSIFVIKDDKIYDVISGIVGKEAYVSAIGKLNEIEFDGESRISDAIMPANVGYGDGMSVIISDFLTESDYENAIERLASKKRDVLCFQVLDKEELNPLVRGKVHFFDSENSSLTYKKNVDRDIAKAYKSALEYATNRIESFCRARNAGYTLIPAEMPINQVVFEKLVNEGVAK